MLNALAEGMSGSKGARSLHSGQRQSPPSVQWFQQQVRRLCLVLKKDGVLLSPLGNDGNFAHVVQLQEGLGGVDWRGVANLMLPDKTCRLGGRSIKATVVQK